MAGAGVELIARVRAVIDALDPEGLLKMGAPDDEYGPEALDFANRIAEGEVMTSEVVQRVWVRWFSADCGLVQQALADAIAERLRDLRP